MSKISLLFFIALLFVVPAIAQEKNGNSTVCKLLPSNQSATYQAGVDAYGNAVAPADLNAAPMGDILNVIKTPLTIDLAKRIAALTGKNIEMKAPIAMMEIHQDGKVLYNGEDITNPVMALCGKSHKDVTIEIVEPETPSVPDTPTIKTTDIKPIIQVVEEPSLPAVSAPDIEEITLPEISQPEEIKKPLVGIPKGTTKTETPDINSDIIKGEDYRDFKYNE